jgi:hypothetical protein
MRLRISKGGIARMRTVAAPVAPALPPGTTDVQAGSSSGGSDGTRRTTDAGGRASQWQRRRFARRSHAAWSASIAHKAITPGFTPDETIDIGEDQRDLCSAVAAEWQVQRDLSDRPPLTDSRRLSAMNVNSGSRPCKNSYF